MTKPDLARLPVYTVSDLFNLDPVEVDEGYRSALDGMQCGDNRSRAFWHGWQNAMIDLGKMEQPNSAISLAADVTRMFGTDVGRLAAAHSHIFTVRREMGIA